MTPNNKSFLFVMAVSLASFSAFVVPNFARAAVTGSTSMTVVTVGSWEEKACKSPPAFENYKVTELMDWTQAYPSVLRWHNSPANTFDRGFARLWAFWSKDGGRYYYAMGWDFTTVNSFSKGLEHPMGSNWIGNAISTICDQTSCPKNPGACNGQNRSTIYFFQN